jgi:hypothetical protein
VKILKDSKMFLEILERYLGTKQSSLRMSDITTTNDNRLEVQRALASKDSTRSDDAATKPNDEEEQTNESQSVIPPAASSYNPSSGTVADPIKEPLMHHFGIPDDNKQPSMKCEYCKSRRPK